MRRYEFRFSADVVIVAQNAAHAHRLAKKLRLIPDQMSGWERPRNNRDGVTYSIKAENQTTTRKREPARS